MPKRRRKQPMPVTNDSMLNVRVPQEVIDRLEAYAAAHGQPGARFTRADAARVLLLEALDRAEKQQR